MILRLDVCRSRSESKKMCMYGEEYLEHAKVFYSQHTVVIVNLNSTTLNHAQALLHGKEKL